MMARLAALLLFALAAPAAAQDVRDLCVTRPGLGTAPCIADRGRIIAELGLGDWTRDTTAESRTDTIFAGDLLLRYGLDGASEVQLGWTAFGHMRERKRRAGETETADGVGDVVLAYKRSLANPDGEGLSLAVQPFVAVPTGQAPTGSGDWGAGLLIPVSRSVGDILHLEFTPEIDAAVDEDGNGRHFAYGGILGIEAGLADHLSATVEASAFRDDDPAGPATEVLGAASIAWLPTPALQLDLGGAFGLNHQSADVRLYLGISRQF